MTTKPPREEVEAVKAEGTRPGWLRSRFMGQPWPRPGVCACGRAQCEVCERAEQAPASAKRRGKVGSI
jgi:hypothetical protein